MTTNGKHRDMSRAWTQRRHNALERRLRVAAALLEAHGYVVLRPEELSGAPTGRHGAIDVQVSTVPFPTEDPDCE